MKNNILVLILVSVFFYFSVSGLRQDLKVIYDNQITLIASNEAVFKKINADDKERVSLLKLQKNLEVWNGTGCIECHNTIKLALPLRKQSVSEAIRIVREGTEASKKGGMPQYLSKNTRGRDSITDSELKVRFDLLYTKEFFEGME